MDLVMAASTEGDQVFFGVITAVAAKFLVVNLQIRSRATQLASPAVTPQDLPSCLNKQQAAAKVPGPRYLLVLFGIEMQSQPLGTS
jgi:hypothetical protein